MSAGAPALGLIFGGPLIALVGWRGVFVLQGAVALAFFPVSRRWLSETARADKVGFDVPGGLVLMVASGSLLFFFDRGSAWGWATPSVLVAAFLFPIAAYAFTRIEKRAASPILPAGMLRRRAYAAPVTAEFLCQMSSNGVFFSAPLLLHETFGRSVTETAFLMLPLPLGMCAGAPVGGRVATRIGERAGGLMGAVSMALSMMVFLAGYHLVSLPLVILALVIQGAANGLVRPSMASAAGAGLEPEFFGVGMATMRMCAQLGSAAGISMAVTARALGGFNATFTAALVVALAAVAVMTRVVSRPRVGLPPAEALRMESIETDNALTTLPAFEG